jgi:hypothetical protein
MSGLAMPGPASLGIHVKPKIVVSNLTFVDSLLGACLYADDPDMAVPWLLLLAVGVLLLSLCIVLLWAAKRRSGAEVHKGAWELLSAMEQSHDTMLHRHLLVAVCAAAFAGLTLVLLLLPIKHRGELAGLVYVGRLPPADAPAARRAEPAAPRAVHGLVDSLALLPPASDAAQHTTAHLVRRGLLLAGIATVRSVGVIDQEPLPQALHPHSRVRSDALAHARRASQYLYPFAPTERSMYINCGNGVAHLLLLGVSLLQGQTLHSQQARRGRLVWRGHGGVWLARSPHRAFLRSGSRVAVLLGAVLSHVVLRIYCALPCWRR